MSDVARNVRKVRQFIDAWGAIDPDAAMACLSQDIVYINQPLPPVTVIEITSRDVKPSRQIVFATWIAYQSG